MYNIISMWGACLIDNTYFTHLSACVVFKSRYKCYFYAVSFTSIHQIKSCLSAYQKMHTCFKSLGTVYINQMFKLCKMGKLTVLLSMHVAEIYLSHQLSITAVINNHYMLHICCISFAPTLHTLNLR